MANVQGWPALPVAMEHVSVTVDRFLVWADKRNIVSVRSAVIYVTVWMTWRLTEWATGFATGWMSSGKSGVEAAAVIAAITVPFATLQAFAFRDYIGGGSSK